MIDPTASKQRLIEANAELETRLAQAHELLWECADVIDRIDNIFNRDPEARRILTRIGAMVTDTPNDT